MNPIIILSILLLVNPLNARSQRISRKSGTLLNQMTSVILKDQYPGIHSVLIAQGGNLFYEHYFNGFNSDSLHDSRSSFKSVTSLLTAMAIDQRLIKNTSERVYPFFPEYQSFKNDGPRKIKMTIQNLLDMESGFDCEEFNGTKDCEDDMVLSKDWVKFSLDLPMKNDPGKVWAYTSCNPMILSGIISRVSHMPIMDFAEKILFSPLGITNYKWTVDPSGNGMTGGSFFIRPADMLKIGQMVLDEGKWKGQQLIAKELIDSFTTANIAIPDCSFAKWSKSKVVIPQPAYYGNYWYHEMLKTKDFQEDLLFASGNGGQYIFIIKRLKLVIVFTQGNYGSWKSKQAFDLLARYIIPAFEKK